jgi:hypothetical protein
MPKYHQPKALSSMVRVMESYEDEGEPPFSSEENTLAALPPKNFVSITDGTLPPASQHENSSDSLTTLIQ